MDTTERSSQFRAKVYTQNQPMRVSDLISNLKLARDSLAANSRINIKTRMELEKSLSQAEAALRDSIKGD